jgi:hypothetical protein
MKKIILTLLTAFFSWYAFSVIFLLVSTQDSRVFNCLAVKKAYTPPAPSEFCKKMEYLQLYVLLSATALTTYFVYKKLSNKKKPAKSK